MFRAAHVMPISSTDGSALETERKGTGTTRESPSLETGKNSEGYQPGRRQRRFRTQFSNGGQPASHRLKSKWMKKPQPLLDRGKFHFLSGIQYGIFLTSFFGHGYGPAKRTGILAAESAGDGALKSLMPKVACQHGGPGHGLKQRPIRGGNNHHDGYQK